ncbi:GNAT family N-acetyltransferase [Desertivirga xinjiangensis]|uniref:GNAT family N-acetyltransferase n=1 Tax=Desertivirga xinjiangensis TaxID=539206 RepID=UPI00210DEA40|nr:GNAT family N-acetyltransferase [Pedobacter xinjiangensis]
MDFTFVSKSFQDLSNVELYEMLKFRQEVFILEQNCVYLDADGKDLQCQHLLMYSEGKLVACARLIPAGLSYAEVSLGRIATSKVVRGSGAGRLLMNRAIEECSKIFGSVPIRISAQYYAKAFYENFGFVAHGKIYDEDGIDHIEMLRTPPGH